MNPSYDMSPALAPRQSASPTTHRSPQPSQGWHSPALSASTASQPTHTPYMSNSWALKSGVSDASVNPTWDSAPPDASTWSVSNRQKHSRVSECISKPPLPVCDGFEKEPDKCDSVDTSFVLAKIKSRAKPAWFSRTKTSLSLLGNND